MNSSKKERLKPLTTIPIIAQLDHRLIPDGIDALPWMKNATRKERKRLEAVARKIHDKYVRHIQQLTRSGARYPVDQLLRQLTIEYTHRYATSGTQTQPTSFNYFEPFFDLKLFPESTAPYPALCTEHNHLFHLEDFLDYTTGSDFNRFELVTLSTLPESQIFHFTTNGNILDLTFLDTDKREFVLSGFSLIRRSNSVHWFLVGGPLYSDEEWELLHRAQVSIQLESIPPLKRAFLEEAIERTHSKSGAPVALEGTRTVRRTILSGEIDLATAKHLGRCMMFEHENTFAIHCDDPEILLGFEPEMAEVAIAHMMEIIGAAGSTWNLAEALLQLPHYFQVRETVERKVVRKAGGKFSTAQKGGRGLGAEFKVVPAVEVVKAPSQVLRKLAPPHYDTETEGHWRRLKPGTQGKDRYGRSVEGRTWVHRESKWRVPEGGSNVVYVKDRLAAAKVKIQEISALAARADKEDNSGDDRPQFGEVYVMRCPIMAEEVYKVGWTSGTAEERAEQLSSETGIPLSFLVVKSWSHHDPRGLEKEIHMLLTPYRLNDRREFFQVSFEVLNDVIERTITRSASRG